MQGDGPSAKQLAKELASLKEKEKELSASLKLMEENLLIARKEKEDIVQFGMLSYALLSLYPSPALPFSIFNIMVLALLGLLFSVPFIQVN